MDFFVVLILVLPDELFCIRLRALDEAELFKERFISFLGPEENDRVTEVLDDFLNEKRAEAILLRGRNHHDFRNRGKDIIITEDAGESDHLMVLIADAVNLSR